MTRKPASFWVVFHRANQRCKWRPTSVHESRSKAGAAYNAQIWNGPEGDHKMRKFEVPR